jgi:hypothetical protein
VLVLLAGLEGAQRALRRLPAGAAAARLDGLVLLLVAVTAAGGLGLLVGGARPRELLHLVYAVVALAALPISTSVSTRWEPRRRGIATVIGALVGLAVIVRLFGTG